MRTRLACGVILALASGCTRSNGEHIVANDMTIAPVSDGGAGNGGEMGGREMSGGGDMACGGVVCRSGGDMRGVAADMACVGTGCSACGGPGQPCCAGAVACSGGGCCVNGVSCVASGQAPVTGGSLIGCPPTAGRRPGEGLWGAKSQTRV